MILLPVSSHTREGSSLELMADDGDERLYKASLNSGKHSTLLHIHSQEGVILGGRPEYKRSSHTTVHLDYYNGKQGLFSLILSLMCSLIQDILY